MRFSAFSDGTLRVRNPEQWSEWLVKRKGQRLEVELRDEAAIRSSRQNRYYWGVCIPFIQECWQRDSGAALPLPKDAVHDALVRALAETEEQMTPLGPGRRSSSSMTVAEFTRLIDAVREYALTKYESHIPTPEEWSE